MSSKAQLYVHLFSTIAKTAIIAMGFYCTRRHFDAQIDGLIKNIERLNQSTGSTRPAGSGDTINAANSGNSAPRPVIPIRK